MIHTKNDLKYYLEQDFKQNKVTQKGLRRWLYIHINPRLHFIYNLRYYEYYYNQTGFCNRLMKLYYYFIHKKLSYKLGFTIYANNFGPGLFIGHYGTIVINRHTRIGSNCTINVDVNIGYGKTTIGNNVYIAPGVKIIKSVSIGNNVMIGANAVVNNDIPDDVVVAGIPAKIIKPVPDYWKDRIIKQ